MPFSDTVLNGVTLTRENFTAPPREMGILPFWFWNGELDYEEMEWQLREYKDRGVPGVFLHGRFGLKVPYLSEEWFERVKFAVEKAKEIGLDMWVYDEMNWPSGTAERQVLEKYPDLKQRYLELVPLHVDGPLFTFLEATDHRYVNTGDSHPVAAFGCRTEEFHNGIGEAIDLMPNLSFNRVIPWETPPGKWSLLYFLEKDIPYYIDTLNPESTERFIELTHEKYKAAVGQEFGTTVPGFYTDEPAMYYYHVGLDNYVIPWSKQMFKIFRERRGYDLRPHLPALYTSMGPRTAQIRYDFWRTLTDQYEETYYKRLRDWCEENGVIFTGHLLFEEMLRLHARCEGNLFKYLRQMHLIGVDHLYPKIGTEQEPDQHVALKIGSSAAHHFGSTRLLCESMGGCYWDCTLERMKWMANWEYVLGVNLFNNHGYHYSIEGERKRDWPPSQFYQHTWWKYYDEFTTYMTRLSHILSGGRHVAKVLVLYPITSIWANYTPQNRDKVTDVIERDFNYLSDALLRLHYDYDYVDEDVLAEANIGDGTIKIRDEEYSVFILPPVTHIKRSTFDALQRFMQSGGSVIGSTLLPVEFMETENTDALVEVKDAFGADSGELLTAFGNGTSPAAGFTHRNSKGNFYFFKGQGLNKEKPREELRRILNKCAVPDVVVSDPEVFYLHRVKDEFDVYFLVNSSIEDRGTVEISFEQVGRPELWNPNTGETSPIHVFDVKDNRVAIQLPFPPSESHIVVIPSGDSGRIPEAYVKSANFDVTDFDSKGVTGYGRLTEDARAEVVSSGNTQVVKAPAKKPLAPIQLPEAFPFRLDTDNVLAVKHWKMTIEQDGASRGYADPDFDDSTWLNVTMGAWEMQLPQERDDQTYPVTLWYRTSFEIGDMPPNTRLMIDGFSGSSYQLFINGKEVSDTGKRSWLDAEIREVEIQDYIKHGKNVVAVKLQVERRTDGMLDLLKVIGDFALEKRGEDYRIVAHPDTLRVGDWTQQGYPFYSGSIVYETEVDLEADYLDGRLWLEADLHDDVLGVSVNGGDEKVLPWRPHRVDISNSVRNGRNSIALSVTNTLINILEGVHHRSGLVGSPRLVHEHRYEMGLE